MINEINQLLDGGFNHPIPAHKFFNLKLKHYYEIIKECILLCKPVLKSPNYSLEYKL